MLGRQRARVLLACSLAIVTTAAFVIAALDGCGDRYTTLESADGSTTASEASAGDGGHDAGTATGDASDARAADAGPRCDPMKPFGAPMRVASLNTAGGGVVRLSYDELSAYQGISDGGPDEDLYVRTRATVQDPFGPPVRIDGVTTTDGEGRPSVTQDGLLLYFDRTTNNASSLQVASRASTSAAFGNVVALSALNGNSNNRAPYVSADGTEVFFFSDRSGGLDIYAAQQEGGAFGAPFALTGVNTPGTEQFPVISTDGKTVYFAADRDAAAGALDIWSAKRPNTSAPFGKPTSVPELNTTSVEVPTWLSADSCRIYLVSDRDAGANAFAVWLAVRPL